MRSWRAGVMSAVAFASCSLAAQLAHAAPAARLVYSRAEGAESCPDEDALRRAVSARVGYDAFFPWATRTIVASLAKNADSFVATVDLIDDHGIRHGGHQLRVQGQCGELLDAVALAVAIAIDPQLLLSPPQPPAPPSPPDTPSFPAPAPVPAPAPDPTPAPATSDPITFEASLGATAGLGFAPEPSLGGTASLGLRWRRFSLAVEGFVAAPITHPVTTASTGSTYDSWPTLVAIVPCLDVWRLYGCAVVQSGALHSEASGAASSSTWWAAVGGRVGIALPLASPFSLRFHLDVLADVSPPNLELRSENVWPATWIAGSLGADLVVRFR